MKILNFIGHATLVALLDLYLFWLHGFDTILGWVIVLFSGWFIFSLLVEGAQFDVELQKNLVKYGSWKKAWRETVDHYDWGKTKFDIIVANGLAGTFIGALLIGLFF